MLQQRGLARAQEAAQQRHRQRLLELLLPQHRQQLLHGRPRARALFFFFSFFCLGMRPVLMLMLVLVLVVIVALQLMRERGPLGALQQSVPRALPTHTPLSDSDTVARTHPLLTVSICAT